MTNDTQSCAQARVFCATPTYSKTDVDAAVAAERERCALIAGDNYGWVLGVYFDRLADAIRGEENGGGN